MLPYVDALRKNGYYVICLAQETAQNQTKTELQQRCCAVFSTAGAALLHIAQLQGVGAVIYTPFLCPPEHLQILQTQIESNPSAVVLANPSAAARERGGRNKNFLGKTNRVIFKLVTDPEERRVGKECRSRWSPYH